VVCNGKKRTRIGYGSIPVYFCRVCRGIGAIKWLIYQTVISLEIQVQALQVREMGCRDTQTL
jgi:hypothetical protein